MEIKELIRLRLENVSLKEKIKNMHKQVDQHITHSNILRAFDKQNKELREIIEKQKKIIYHWKEKLNKIKLLLEEGK